MMKSLALLFPLSLWAGNLAVQPKLEFESVPDDLDYFIQQPTSCDVDDDGNCYILDLGASVIFVWNSDGSFSHTIGKPGEGPGELSFMARGGGPQGYVGAHGKSVYVYNGSKRNLEVFNRAGEYQRSIALDIRGGRTGSFYVTSNSEFLIYQQSFMRETPQREVILFNPEGKDPKVITSIEDTSFKREGSGNGRPTAIVIKAYAPTLFMTYNASANQIVTAATGKPEFQVKTLGKDDNQTVKVALHQRETTDFDRTEFGELNFIKNSTFFKPEYPEKMPFFSRILFYGDKFLVFNESPFTHKVEGYLVDNKGTMHGRIDLTCGQGGSLMGSHGRIIAAFVDDEGDVSIKELAIGGES